MYSFLRDLTVGKKKYIKCGDMMYLYAPQYEKLDISTILGLVETRSPLVLEYLPDKRDHHRLPRQFILNVTYTILGDDFSNYVDLRVKERNETLAMK